MFLYLKTLIGFTNIYLQGALCIIVSYFYSDIVCGGGGGGWSIKLIRTAKSEYHPF